MTQALKNALLLAQHKIFVFPIKANCKHPPLIKWAAGCSHDAEVIKSWAEQWPGCNFGIATGPSNLLVLDVDQHGVDGEATVDALELEHGELPATLQAATPSGGRSLCSYRRLSSAG